MLKFNVLTLYPDIFERFLTTGIMGKGAESGYIKIETIDYRDKGIGKHHKVDAPPYGGGAGMVLRPEPIYHALEECEAGSSEKRSYKILLSPQGRPFNQEKALSLSKQKIPITLICGRFEGFDERVRNYIDDEISLGDFVLMGGEIAAMAILESTCRLIPGVLGNSKSVENESHSAGLLEYAQYTRPFEFRGEKVPAVLLSGNHQEISKWRKEDSLGKTRDRRPDLYQTFLKKTD